MSIIKHNREKKDKIIEEKKRSDLMVETTERI